MSRTAWADRRNAEDEPQVFVFCVAGSTFEVSRPPLLEAFSEGTKISYHPHIDMVHGDGSVSVWSPNQADLFAGDWEIMR